MLIFHLFSKFEIQQHPPLRKLVSLSSWLFAVLTFFALSFKYFEAVSWQESVWQVWQTATTVGYGNRPAQTFTGQWATIIFGLLCISFLGACISAIFDAKAYLRDRKRSGLMKNPFKDGYVVFNFPGTDVFKLFANEVRSVEADVPICIVDEKLEELPTSIATLKNIHFVKGELLAKETYKKACITDNKIVVVFPSDANASESDGTTKTIVDLVLKFINNNKTRVVYSLVKAENEWMFNSNATGASRNLDILALVQECQDMHSAQSIQTLLMNTEGPNPQTVIPTYLIGWTWRQFITRATAVSIKWGILFTPLALIHEEKAYVCPPYNMIINEKDLISVIAYEDFNWEFFEKQLIRVDISSKRGYN